jgi:hypothetical protein
VSTAAAVQLASGLIIAREPILQIADRAWVAFPDAPVLLLRAVVSGRTRLPNRRPALTEIVTVAGHEFAATIGFDRRGQPKEVFLAGAREGSDLQFVIDDASIVISLALQYGVPARALAASMSRLPVARPGERGAAASVIGAAVDLLTRIEGGSA